MLVSNFTDSKPTKETREIEGIKLDTEYDVELLSDRSIRTFVVVDKIFSGADKTTLYVGFRLFDRFKYKVFKGHWSDGKGNLVPHYETKEEESVYNKVKLLSEFKEYLRSDLLV